MKTAINGTWLLLSGVYWGGLGFACQGALAKPGITIRVLNPARVPAKTLQKAEQVATAILDAAGVGITWLECPCLPYLGPNEFWLHVLEGRPPGMHGDATGFAVLMHGRDRGASYAAVIWPAVEEAAAGLDSQVSQVLGATVAHEIGHILLASKAHTRSGIMCSRFRSADMRMAASGQLRFTPEQARRMQAVVARYSGLSSTLLHPSTHGSP
jgi:hypothetical protein